MVRGIASPCWRTVSSVSHLSIAISNALGGLTTRTPLLWATCSAFIRKIVCSSDPIGMVRTINAWQAFDSLSALAENWLDEPPR